MPRNPSFVPGTAAKPKFSPLVTTLLWAALLNYPLLSVLDKNRFVMGVPVLFVGIFGIWVAMIAYFAFKARRALRQSQRPTPETER